MQKWFGESGPGEGLPDLKGGVFLSMFSAWTIWFFLALESGKIGKKAPKFDRMGAKSIKNEARGTPWEGRGGQDGGRREGNQQNLYF